MTAPTREASIRVGITGKAETKAGLKEVRDAGTAAFDDVAKAADKSSAALDKTAAKANTAAAAVENVQKRAAGAALDFPSDVVTPKASAPAPGGSTSPAPAPSKPRITYQEKQIAAGIIADVDPVLASAINYEKAIKRADIALKAELITEDQHKAFLAKSKKALDDVTEAHNALGKSASLNRGQVAELTSIFRHSFDQLSAGADITRVFTTHVASLGQALGSGEGGLAGGLGAVAEFVNPVTAGIAVLGGAILLLTTHALGLNEQARALDTTLTRLSDGQRSNLGVLTDNARAIRDLGAGTKDATAEVQEFLQKGVDPTRMRQFGKDAQDLHDIFGTALPDAAKTVSEAFTGTYDDVAKLDDQLNFLTASERENIKAMFDSGDAAHARAQALDLFSRKMDEAAQKAVGPWGQALRDLKAGYSGVLDEFAKTDLIQLDIKLFDQLASKISTVARLFQSESTRGDAQVFGDYAAARLKLNAAEDARNANIFHAFGHDGALDVAVAQAKKRVDDIQTILAQRSRVTIDPKVSGVETEKKAVNALVEAASPHNAQVSAAQDAINRISATLNQPGLSKAEIDKKTAAIAFYKKEIEDWQKPKGQGHAQQLQRDADAVQVNIRETLKLADAYQQGDAAALEAEARRKALTDATRKGTDAEAAYMAQMQLAIAQEIANGNRSALALRDQAAAQKSVNDSVAAGTLSARDAAKALQEENALRPLTTALLANENEQQKTSTQLKDAETAQNAKRVAALQSQLKQQQALHKDVAAAIAAHKVAADAADNSQNVAAVQASTAANKDQIAVLRDQIDVMGKGNAERAVELAQRAAIRDLENRKIPIDSVEGKSAVQTATDLAKTQNEKAGADYYDQLKRSQADDLEYTKLKIDLVGKTDAQQQTALDRLRLEQELRTHIGEVTQQQIQDLLKAYDLGADMIGIYQRQAAAVAEIRGLQDQAFGDLETFLDAGKYSLQSFGDLGKTIFTDLKNEAVKLALINPLKNWLFHEDNPTLADTITARKKDGASTGTGPSSISSTLMKVAGFFGFESGTRSGAPDGLQWVGENGPELLKTKSGDQIFNHEESERFAAKMTGPKDIGEFGFGSRVQEDRPIGPQHFGGGQVIVVQPQYHDFRGAVVTEDLLKQSDQRAKEIAAQAAAVGADQAVKRAGKNVPIALSDWETDKG